MEKIKLYELIEAVDGSYGMPADVDVEDISTDTRKITTGSVFVALSGERFDGHDFAKKAMELGAVAVITERAVEGARCIIVDSTAKALLDIATFYRSKFNPLLVGVTGSVGKTTTKEMLALVLSKGFETLKTQGNLNNEIGLPMTIFQMNSAHQAVVLEMGMSHFGEISRLSMTAKPSVAVITNIGYSHIENLGSQENILKAKLEILDGADYNAPLVINLDDKLLSTVPEKYTSRKILTYAVKNKNADVFASDIVQDENGISFTINANGEKFNARLNCLGEHNILNALSAFCVGRYAEIDPQKILDAIAEFQPDGLRQNVTERDKMTYIIDCYNASPDSMKSALSLLSNVKTSGRRVAVLADMLELGKFSVKLHKTVGEYCVLAKPDMLVCYGNDARYIAETASKSLENVKLFDDKQATADFLSEYLKVGDAVLFKGSRGMKLEEIIEAIKPHSDK